MLGELILIHAVLCICEFILLAQPECTILQKAVVLVDWVSKCVALYLTIWRKRGILSVLAYKRALYQSVFASK